MRFTLVILFFVCFLFSCKVSKVDTQVSSTEIKTERPKNIIFLIGDGMGLAQISAGMYSNNNKIALESFPVIGLHKPHANNKLITDSAAAATAFACGVKTYNGAIGVNGDSVAVETILEKAENKGMATGLVATSTIVHATPASFISHNKYRKNYEEIALDFLNTEVDVFIGGGKKFFERREDKRNLVQELKDSGYIVSDFFEGELDDMSYSESDNWAYFTADTDPLPVLQGRNYLPTASRKSIEHLKLKSKEKGFFLMVEGSQIDWGGHSNQTDYVISEFLEFDQVIEETLAWAKEDKETLVVVTADHETGGFAIQDESTMGNIVAAYTSTNHTGVMIPVFAYGPGAKNFAGIYENTDIHDKMVNLLFPRNLD